MHLSLPCMCFQWGTKKTFGTSNRGTRITIGKSFYSRTRSCCCFAEDAFGGQFCILEDTISKFDPETGEFEFLAPNLTKWAEMILRDFEILTAYPLAHEWQLSHRKVKATERLVPT